MIGRSGVRPTFHSINILIIIAVTYIVAVQLSPPEMTPADGDNGCRTSSRAPARSAQSRYI